MDRFGRATAVGSFDADVPGGVAGDRMPTVWGTPSMAAHVGLGRALLPMTSPTVRGGDGGRVCHVLHGRES